MQMRTIVMELISKELCYEKRPIVMKTVYSTTIDCC